MFRALKLFAFFAGSAFGLASAVYRALSAIMPHHRVFGSWYRMFTYHEAHPYQYIAVVALTCGVIATGGALRWGHLRGWRLSIAIAGIVVATVVAASMPGGMLWKIHDMQAGWFTTGKRFWSDLLLGALMGLQCGWLVIALSVPYNIIGLIAGYPVTRFGFRIAEADRSSAAAPAAIGTGSRRKP